MQEDNVPIILVNDMPIFLKDHGTEDHPFVNKFIEGFLAKLEAEQKEVDDGSS